MSDLALNTLCLSKGKPGIPILLLHGWAHSLEVVRPLGELLSEHSEVHLLDLPGHGSSEEPSEIWGMEDFAKRVAQYLEEQGITKVDIIGHSFGGKTACKLSVLRPELIRKIVLINSSGIVPRRSLKKRIKFRSIALLRWFVKRIDRFVNLSLFEKWFIPKFASPDYLNAGTIRKTFVRTLHEDLSEELKTIRSPALLLWGEIDTETPLEMGHRMEALIPNSRLIVLQGKGHEPFHGPGAHLCAYHIAPFLQESETQSEERHA